MPRATATCSDGLWPSQPDADSAWTWSSPVIEPVRFAKYRSMAVAPVRLEDDDGPRTLPRSPRALTLSTLAAGRSIVPTLPAPTVGPDSVVPLTTVPPATVFTDSVTPWTPLAALARGFPGPVRGVILPVSPFCEPHPGKGSVMSRFACRLPPVGLLLPAAALLAAAPVPDVPDRRPPHQVEAARQLLAKLKKEAAAPQVDVDALWKLWQQMRLEHGGSPECLATAAVMSKAPSPLDRLDRNQIPAEDRLPWLPKEVVAVLGEHRGRHWGAVWEVVVSPDGALVISAAVDGLRMWDAGTMHEVQAFPDYLVATFSPDGRTVALAHRSDGTVRLFDRRGGKLTQRLVLHCKRLPERMNERDRWADEARKEKGVRPSAQEMRFDDDGKRLIAVCNDQALRAWDLTGKGPLEKTAHDTHRFGNRLVLLSGNCLAAFGGAKENSLWEVNGITIRRRGELPMGTQPVALRPDGKMLATGVGGPGPISLRLLDLSGKAPRVSRDLLDIRGLRAVAFAPDGRLLASLDADRVLRLWPLDEAKRQELRLPRQATHRASPLSFPATCLVFLPDGKTLALGGDDGTVRLWDLAKSAERFPTRGHTGRVLDVAFSPDGKVLASLGDDRTVRLWDLTGAGPKERAVLKRQGVGVASVAFAAGRPLLAVAETPIEGSDAVPKGNVRVWDLSGDAPKERFAFQAHSHGVTGVAFSPDGRRLITAGRDVALPQGKDDVDPALVTIGLWEIKDGKA